MRAPDIRLCLGKGGSGKTFLALHWARKFPRVIFHDPTEDEGVGAAFTPVDSPSELVRLVKRPQFQIAWRGFRHPPDYWKEFRTDPFEFCNAAGWGAGNLAMVWDEVDLFTASPRLPPFAYQLLHQGRHRGVHLIACSRRPRSVKIDFRALATRIAAFRTQEPDDVKYLADRIGGAAALELATLSDRHCLDWSESGFSLKKSPFS